MSDKIHVDFSLYKTPEWKRRQERFVPGRERKLKLLGFADAQIDHLKYNRPQYIKPILKHQHERVKALAKEKKISMIAAAGFLRAQTTLRIDEWKQRHYGFPTGENPYVWMGYAEVEYEYA